MRIAPKNWGHFQHYKDRKPPWIRLHRDLLDNQEFNTLPPMACKVLVLLWLVASEEVNGIIDGDPARLAFRLRLPVAEVSEAMECLMSFGFFTVAEESQETPNGFGSRYIPDKVRREVWERDGGTCRNCQSKENIEYDHIHPVSKGGTSEASNVQLLCRTCNRKKRVRLAEQVATQAQPDLNLRTSETETETETEKTLSGKPDPHPPEKQKLKTEARDILQFLNAKAGRAFPALDANLDLIVARLKEGATAAQCRQVIAKKTREWGGDEKMAEYIRPKTLFSRTNFAQYVGELVVTDG